MSDLEAYLKEVSSREKAATNGPWKAYPHGEPKHPNYSSCDRLEAGEKGIVAMLEGFCAPACSGQCDIQFIAHARTDIPKLLAIIETLREALELISSSNHFKEGEYGFQFPLLSREALSQAEKIAKGE